MLDFQDLLCGGFDSAGGLSVCSVESWTLGFRIITDGFRMTGFRMVGQVCSGFEIFGLSTTKGFTGVGVLLNRTSKPLS